MKVTMSAEVKVDFTTVEALRGALENIPATAKVGVRTEKHYDQRDPGGTWLTFRWTEER